MVRPQNASVRAPSATPIVNVPSHSDTKKRSGKAYELLANQPSSLVGLSAHERNQVVVSAVLDDEGQTVVISRVCDLVWDLWPFVTTPNTIDFHKCLDWSGIPEAYREACQNVLFHYWKVGRPGWEAPGVGTLLSTLKNMRHLCKYAAERRLHSLADMQALHIANFVHAQRQRIKPKTLLGQCLALDLLYQFRSQHEGSLQVHPWPDSSNWQVSGLTGQQGEDVRMVGSTPLISMDVAQTLYRYSKRILEHADALLDECDGGIRSAYQDPEINAIRNACFYLIGVLTGMRSSELSSIEVGAGRTEVINGITFHWLASVEHKTKKGKVEYLMPFMLHDVLRIMERWSKPYRERLAGQIRAMEAMDGRRTAKELQWLVTARTNTRRLFLGNRYSGITPLSGTGWGKSLKALAVAAGTDWLLAPHQMRRLYAYTFVRHRLGDLLFLKEQFKHSSIDMSQLYGSNRRQDAALYDEILSELMAYKTGVVAQWLEKDEPLAGGAAAKIKKLRAHDFKGRRELLTETSHRISIRSTGHSWCLAQDEGCGGSGIYAKGSCGDCSNGLIDSRFIPLWQEAYRHHHELLAEAKDLGPGVERRVERDLAQAAKILKDLGLDLDNKDGNVQLGTSAH